MTYDQDDEILSVEPDGTEEAGLSEAELDAAESKVDAKVTKLKHELEQCRKEKQEYLDGWQRAKADYVNAQKRAIEDRVQGGMLATRKTLEAFLPALDSLARAEVTGEIPTGFEGIAKQLRRSAEAAGLAPFGTVGDSFDPMMHEALGEDAASEATADHTVSAVLEPGWTHQGAVLRPARVRVFVANDGAS